MDFLECAAKEKAQESEAAKKHHEVLCSDIVSVKVREQTFLSAPDDHSK